MLPWKKRSSVRSLPTLPTPVTVTNAAPVLLLFATDVFGLLRVTQASTPVMLLSPIPNSPSSTNSTPHRGTTVNIVSIMGVRALPWTGIYGASRHAVHGLSDALRLEVRGLGIKVVTIAPGAVATHFSQNINKSDVDKANLSPSSPTTKSTFYPNMADIGKFRNSAVDLSKGTNPDVFAKAVVDAVTTVNPPQFYVAGGNSFIFKIIPFLP